MDDPVWVLPATSFDLPEVSLRRQWKFPQDVYVSERRHDEVCDEI